MPFCTSCGSQIEPGAERCSCGAAIGGAAAGDLPIMRFRCTGQGVPLLVLYLKTLILSVLTLGVYSFWGRTEIRRYLAEETWAGADRFAWHGTGLELLVGWLKAFGIIVALYAGFFLASVSGSDVVRVAATVVLYLGIFAVLPLIIVASTRYRLSRTSLRGIHFSSTARVGEFAKLYYKGMLLTLLTLGFYSPWFANDIVGYLTRHSRWGDHQFDFDGEGKDLFGAYVIWLVLLLPTLYLISFWYLARQQRYYWDHTTFGQSRFSCSLRGRQVLGTMLLNGILIALTLGIAYPWAVLRKLRLQCDTLELHGVVPFSEVKQKAMAATATGEGAAALLDVDADVGGAFGI